VIGFVKQDIVELQPINHFPAPTALVEMFFLRFAQLVKVNRIHLKGVYKSSVTWFSQAVWQSKTILAQS
jgi:hypothetical protein